jgi:hypothetical protein
MMRGLPDSLTQVNVSREQIVRDYCRVAKPRHSEAGRRLARLVVELDREHAGRGSQSRVAEKTGLDKGQITAILADPDAPRDVTARTIEDLLRGPLRLRPEYFFASKVSSYRDYVQAPRPATEEAPAGYSAEAVVLDMATAYAGSKHPLSPAEIDQLKSTGRALAAAMGPAELRDGLESLLSGWRAAAEAKKRTARRR